MAFHFTVFLILLLFSPLNCSQSAVPPNQSQFFTLVKKYLTPLSDWDVTRATTVCNFTGISCNEQGHIVGIDISGWSLSGRFPEYVCSYLPELRILRLGRNNFHGNFPHSITNCSLLEELNMSSTYLTGTLPDFSPMTSLKLLDLSYNLFTGDFPISVTNLTNLEVLNFNENEGFNLWRLPENFSRLPKLKSMVLTTCMVSGLIPASIGNMTALVDLELSGNFLVGQIPVELGLLKNVQQLELYYNQLDGEIPEEFGNLSELSDLDMSVNKLTGKIPKSIFHLPKLEVLQLYNNSLAGEIPDAIANLTTLTTLSLYDNMLTGEVPRGLGGLSSMVILELSENQLSGELPGEACSGGKLQYFLVLQNMFSGKVPESYATCESLLRFRVSSNRLEGAIPEGLLALPHVSIIDLGYNRLNGSISKTIANAKNLSELFIQSTRISGVLPPEISQTANLVKIDLSNNLLSGPIPSEIGNLRKLNLLMLQGNKFNSSIPNSLSSLKSLNVLDLSNNLFTGNIPESLCELIPNSMNFSDNQLSGPIPLSFIKGGLLESFSGNPSLCVQAYLNSSDTSFPICSQSYNRKKVNCIWVIGISVAIVPIGIVLFLKRWFSKEHSMMDKNDSMSSSFFLYDVKSFHRISFDQREIVEAMVDKNIVGHGGSGTVYKIELSNREVIAVKKLWSRRTKDSASEDQFCLDKELKTEVDTLGSIRHKNIVKLYCYLSSLDSSLLVYDQLNNSPFLLMLVTEYAYSSKATTKCDVYSFGVVLMELITGRKPVEADFGENKNIIYWVSTKVETKEGAMEVLDNRLSGLYKDEMIKVLMIAIRCTYKTPGNRPTMNEVVQLLIEADPCRFDICKSSNKAKETAAVTMAKNPYDL
ncbi:leucine-rich repeat transmembrane protein kinase family protein [Actinidia rufa]|uniref:Leucine-rich repeat transmembrane protein kinase family protein n=1 Tax=Actinidia rufa TaxID=165716 RepID=A0A7J0GH58_9ERIC|nr:leucine-rich repeat transmembrane protein kinase family protein [Actinidia rufa]